MKVINLKPFGVIAFNSKLTAEAIKALQKHIPSALKMRDQEGNDIFAISYKEGQASISEYGICFNKTDSEGCLLLTVAADMTNKEIADEYAAIIMKAKEIEEWALNAYAQLTDQLLDVEASIENLEMTEPELCECACEAPEITSEEE